MRCIAIGIFLLSSFSAKSQSMADFQTDFTAYAVNPVDCNQLEHFSGSRIYFPENAFAGVGASDSVTIYYRELRTPLDMIIHNVNMHTSLAGKSYPLESNGMFEIYAKNGEDTLQLNEGKSIAVQFALESGKVDPRMEGFKYDQESEVWLSYTQRVGGQEINENDEKLWGSSPVGSDDEPPVEWSGADGGGWGDGFGDDWGSWEESPEDSARRAVRAKAFQAMEISDFGFFNYDRIMTDVLQVPIAASFVDQETKEIEATVYVIYDNINSVFSYPRYTWDESFSLIRGEPYRMLAIAEDLQVMQLEDGPDPTEIKDQPHAFQLTAQGKKPESRKELASITGIQ